jgi:hypothetical protein
LQDLAAIRVHRDRQATRHLPHPATMQLRTANGKPSEADPV